MRRLFTQRWWVRHGPALAGLVAVALAGAARAEPAARGGVAALGASVLLATRGRGFTASHGARVLALALAAAAGIAGVAALAGLVPGFPPLAGALVALVAAALVAVLLGAADAACEALVAVALTGCLLTIAAEVAAAADATASSASVPPAVALGTAAAGAGALLHRRRSSLVRALSHDGPAGSLVRRHVAAAALAPLGIACAAALGARFGLYAPEWAAALVVAGTTAVLLGATRFRAAAAFRLESEHAQLVAERAARGEAERHAHLLEERGRALQDALALRDEFLTVAAHELRTPLTVVALNVQSFARSSALDLRAQRRIHAVRGQIARLEAMIDGLLDASRLADGELELRDERVDLAGVVRDVVRGRAEDLEASGSPLRLRADGGVVGRWDRRRVGQIVDRLLDNAMKYGNGSPIEVSVDALGGHARLVVRDGGIGISADRRGRLFERYGRAVSERNYGGFGLGLWTAKQLVHAMGGNIGVDSAEGEGTTFVVELPCEGAAAHVGTA